MIERSPLRTVAESDGARYTGYSQDLLPEDFGDFRAEYDSAREGAALFDISSMGKLEVSGPDAPKFLHNLSTNDIEGLPLGGGCESYFCDHRAKTLFQTWIYHVRLDGGRDALWVDTPGEYADALLAHLDRYLISEQVELKNRTTEFAQMQLAGPAAKSVLEQALDEDVPDLTEFLHMERTFGNSATCSIRRRDPLGVPGYDIVCLTQKAEAVWRMLTAAGAKPAGEKAFEVLRIEAGTPIYGQDIDENRFVMEIGRATRAVSYAKGCFLGQEPIVMARDRAGHVPRAFLPIRLSERVTEPGSKLRREGKDVGVVTSSIDSPRLGGPMALAYIRRGYQDPGTVFNVEDNSGTQTAEVLAPMT